MPTPAPMTLAAMKAFAQRQHAHYAELLAVLTKIEDDPLSVVPRGRSSPRRGDSPRKKAPAAPRDVLLGAVRTLGVATTREIVTAAAAQGWQSTSDNPLGVAHMALVHMVKLGLVRRVTGAGRNVRWALATPTKRNQKKLAAAQALAAATEAPGPVPPPRPGRASDRLNAVDGSTH